MTKKHCKELAEALRHSCPMEGIGSLDYYQWQKDCQAVADVCRKFNANFNYVRFIDACEGR